MIPDWTLEKLATFIHGTIYGRGDLPVKRLSIDSRVLTRSGETLFVAIKGEQHDGHNYIAELYSFGIRSFLVSMLPDCQAFPDAGFCYVKDTLLGLQGIANASRLQFDGEVLAITGSNGKTIVKEWLHQCLGERIRIHRSPKSYNSQVGVPLSVWGVDARHELALIEAGISRPGEMEKLQQIIQPDTGIFTNLGTAHQENFNSLEEKLKEKLKLFQGCKKVICRSDVTIASRSLLSYMEELETEIVDWSLGGEARYIYTLTGQTPAQTRVHLKHEDEETDFILPFADDASVENALHVLSYCLERGLPREYMRARMAILEPVSMRLEILQGTGGSMLINDTYNSDTGGVAAALDLMGQQDTNQGRIVILSDLLQSGMEDKVLYSEIASLLRSKELDQFIGIGPALTGQRALFPATSLFYPDTEEFLAQMDRARFNGRTVLIKGSRSYAFERITRELQLKTHQTRLETDLNAMVHNLNHFRSLLSRGVQTMVMVKALTYGSGNIEIARLLQYHQVDYLAVAFIDEGVELRKAGIHLPIMVLNPDPSGFGYMLDYHLEPEIYNLRGVQALHKILHNRGIIGFPVHVKLDTGMHRLGFGEEDLGQLLPWLQEPEIEVSTVFSHLAASGDPDHDRFTEEQINRFNRMSSLLLKETGGSFRRHILNSSGIERFPDAQYDMVRLGIGLHGIGQDSGLKAVSSFKTTISQLRSVQAGETVGYSRSGLLKMPGLIATIPVGYADGFHRSLGNGAGSVYVNGHLAPTIGDICMDMAMIDVTGLDVSEGDTVEMFGKHQSVTLLAKQAGTIPYEILSSVPERVKRVYLQE
ncbi:MAG: bifunctional UDP-N-acetylmuramoyl-tripeptide:D-alanyl-D-alanine ligase/alanine racemase [Bacteroidales bacterium]|nr:bifunctional UDP-N-acetylmuramoyl-tripeptide:D-alanyl-D-alanine ligase/alanine racemase [Bacteroidales bacterium]